MESSFSPQIKIQKIAGNLRIKGWDRSEIRADSNKADTLTIENQEDTYTITCQSGCILRVPVDSIINIDVIHGDLMAKSLENKIEAQTINGHILAKSVGPLNIGTAKGNINIKYVEGDFSVDDAKGTTNIQDVEGHIAINKSTGNLTIKGYSCSISANTNANATLRLDPKLGGEFNVRSGGNIHCRLEPDASANTLAACYVFPQPGKASMQYHHAA